MEPRRSRVTIRNAMTVVVILAVLLSFYPMLCREFAPTPAEWARDSAMSWAEPNPHLEAVFPNSAETRRSVAKQYDEFAKDLEREGAEWREETWHGPFSDQLALGEIVMLWHASQARAEEDSDLGCNSLELLSLGKGVICEVVKDNVCDADSCDLFREITVRIMNGPHQGKHALIQRNCLCRKP